MTYRRLDQRFKALEASADDLSTRQKTMRAAALFHTRGEWERVDACHRELTAGR